MVCSFQNHAFFKRFSAVFRGRCYPATSHYSKGLSPLSMLKKSVSVRFFGIDIFSQGTAHGFRLDSGKSSWISAAIIPAPMEIGNAKKEHMLAENTPSVRSAVRGNWQSHPPMLYWTKFDHFLQRQILLWGIITTILSISLSKKIWKQ